MYSLSVNFPQFSVSLKRILSCFIPPEYMPLFTCLWCFWVVIGHSWNHFSMEEVFLFFQVCLLVFFFSVSRSKALFTSVEMILISSFAFYLILGVPSDFIAQPCCGLPFPYVRALTINHTCLKPGSDTSNTLGSLIALFLFFLWFCCLLFHPYSLTGRQEAPSR